jgi:hypothetical protein
MYSSVRDLGKIMSLFFRDDQLSNQTSQFLDGASIKESLNFKYLDNSFEDGFATPWEAYKVNNIDTSNH